METEWRELLLTLSGVYALVNRGYLLTDYIRPGEAASSRYCAKYLQKLRRGAYSESASISSFADSARERANSASCDETATRTALRAASGEMCSL